MADGPGPAGEQDAKAWICSPDLVPCLLWSPPVPFGAQFRACIGGVHGGWRYLLQLLENFFYQLSRYKNPRRSPGFPQWMCWGWKEWEDCPLSLCEWDGLQGCEIVSPGSPAERSKPLKTHGHVVEHVGGRGGERWLKSFCKVEKFTSIWTIYDEKLHWLLPFGNCKVFHTSLVCRVVLKVVSDSYPPRVEFQWYNKSGTLEFYQNLLYNEIWTSFYIPKYQVTNWLLVTHCCVKVSKSPF